MTHRNSLYKGVSQCSINRVLMPQKGNLKIVELIRTYA